MFKISRSIRECFVGVLLWTSFVLASPGFGANNIIDSTYGTGAGSFELGAFVPNATDPLGRGSYMVLPQGSTTITGWTVGSNGIDWIPTPPFGTSTQFGMHAVDLTEVSPSSISTVIPTIAGQRYLLSFHTATVVTGTGAGAVSAGSLVDQAFTAPASPTIGAQVFAPFRFLFTANDALTTVTFRSTQFSCNSDCYGPALDAVSVSAFPVPEPQTYPMLLTGLGILGLAAYRGSKRKGMIGSLVESASGC